MHLPIPLAVFFGLALTVPTVHAAADPHPLQPGAPRTVVVLESDKPPEVRTGLLQSTLIVLSAEEKVANVFAGDTVNWIFDGGHVASRFISVKPKTANAATDIHIVSDHGNEYTLQLREVSNDPDAHFDSKVFLNPGDQAAKDRLAQLPVFVPASEFDKAKQEAAAAKAAQAAELKAEQTRQSSTVRNTPARCTSTTRGMRRRGKNSDSSRSGATTSSLTCAASSRKRPRSTKSRTRNPHSSTSISTAGSIPCRSCWRTDTSPSANRRSNSTAQEARTNHDRPDDQHACHDS